MESVRIAFCVLRMAFSYGILTDCENVFEKTKPIYVGRNWRKVFYERRL
jgi:hypothetical protein